MKQLWAAVTNWVEQQGGWSHAIFLAYLTLVGAYAESPSFAHSVQGLYAIMPVWTHEVLAVVGGFVVWYTKTQKTPPNAPPAAPVAAKVGVILLVAALGLTLTGCPNTSASQAQQVATAAENASIVVKDFQQGEIAAHQQGLIPDADHQFIEQQLETIATIGKTADSCIKATTSNAGIVTCTNAAIAGVNQINSQGGLYLKSDKAKTDFALAMTGIKTAYAVIAAIFSPAATN